VETTGAQALGWALLPNHLHLLVRTGRRPLASMMRRLLAGYAGSFNRRHKRNGHLFQNRYKSIVVEEEPYLLELTRYIHLNPLRAGLVQDLRALDRFPWCGHSAVLGRIPRRWQAVDVVLAQFATKPREARRRYRTYVAEGMLRGRRPELQGGGLRRSLGGWEALVSLRRGREGWAFDERVLGSGEFVEQLLGEVAPHVGDSARAWRSLPVLVERLAGVFGVRAAEILNGSRRRSVTQARAAVGAIGVKYLGLPVTRVATVVGVTGMAVLRGIDRGLLCLSQRDLDPERLAKWAMKQV
jgi:hypothetical protein